MATAVSVLGPAAGLELVEATPGAAAFIVQAVEGDKPRTFASSRFPQESSAAR
jgi:thiamine biosynthesis lipoprotein ApbE